MLYRYSLILANLNLAHSANNNSFPVQKVTNFLYDLIYVTLLFLWYGDFERGHFCAELNPKPGKRQSFVNNWNFNSVPAILQEIDEWHERNINYGLENFDVSHFTLDFTIIAPDASLLALPKNKWKQEFTSVVSEIDD